MRPPPRVAAPRRGPRLAPPPEPQPLRGAAAGQREVGPALRGERRDADRHLRVPEVHRPAPPVPLGAQPAAEGRRPGM